MDTKTKILKAALLEFSRNGLKGSRVEIIAREASVNKAMIFYYFSSKQVLYEEVLRKAMKEFFIEMGKKIAFKPTVKNVVKKLPGIHIGFLKNNPEFVKMITLSLIQEPETIKKFIKDDFIKDLPVSFEHILKKIKKAHEKGIVKEEDPLQFIINIISLNVFMFIAKPVFEGVFGIDFDKIEGFYDKRVESIQNLINTGMMK